MTEMNRFISKHCEFTNYVGSETPSKLKKKKKKTVHIKRENFDCQQMQLNFSVVQHNEAGDSNVKSIEEKRQENMAVVER